VPGCFSSRCMLLLATAGCAFALISPYRPARSQEQPPSDTVTYPVDGVVENSLTHQPIARVLVSSMSDEVLSDNEGRFELHLPAGMGEIRLRRPGYGGGGFMSMMMPDMPHRIIVAAGMAPLILYLTPAASIVAHVTLSSGDEPDGVRFTLYRRQAVNLYAQWAPIGNTVSDSQGDVRFPALSAPASYVFCSAASSDHAGPAAPGVRVYGYPGLCFPGGIDFASAIAAPLKLGPGQDAEFDVALDRQPFYPVTISVSGAGQNPAPFIQVHTASGEPTDFATYRDGPNGPTVFHLPNGSYYAEASAGRGLDSRRYARVDFTVAGGPVSGLMLVPVPVQPLSVEIRRDFTASTGEDSQPPAGFRLPGNFPNDSGLPDDSSPAVNISLVPPLDTAMGSVLGGALRHATSAPEGDYLWDITAQGRFRVQVNSFGPYYVSSITMGATDLARDLLVIGPGGSTQPIEIVLRNDFGQLLCTYAPPPSSSAPSAPAAIDFNPVFVYAIPLFPSVERLHQGIARAAGQPSIPLALPPGSYLVVAALGPQQIDLDDAPLMSRLNAAGQKVTIQPGQTTTVAFDKLIGGDDGGDSTADAAENNP